MTPLVLVHGFMGGSDQWALQASLGAHRRLICLDLPGFGKNADLAPLDSIAGFATWALDEVSRLGITRFSPLGHSMGGMIVQDMIRQAPDRVDRLILYGTGAKGVLPGRFETIETSMTRAQADGAEATAKRIAATWFLAREDAPGYPDCAGIACQSSLPAILSGLAAMRDWCGADHLEAIQSETLVLWGDRDRTYAWPQIEELWRRIRTSHLAVVPQAAHAVHAERAGLFNQIVSEFLGPS